MSYLTEVPGSNPDESVWLYNAILAFVTILCAVRVASQSVTTTATANVVAIATVMAIATAIAMAVATTIAIDR